MLERELNFYKKIANKLREINFDCVYQLEYNFSLTEFLLFLTDWPSHKNIETVGERINGDILDVIERFSWHLDSAEPTEKTCSDFLFACISCLNAMFPITFLSNEKIIFYYPSLDHKLPIGLKILQDNFPIFNSKLSLQPYPSQMLSNVIKERIEHWQQIFNINSNDNYLNFLYKKFEDELSRISFKTYMKQRLHGWVMGGYPIIYPVLPPKESRQWREKRRSLEYDLPILEGVPEVSKKFFYDSNWKMLQYAIPGACEVMPGDIVIDAGAFIGDTALYFAKIVGPLGKVYAFEPIQETIEILKKNVKLNEMEDIIIIVPKALSNKSQLLYFTSMGSDSSAVEPTTMANSKDKFQCIEATSLDDFVDKNFIKNIDFLKADLQGFDVAFIEGGMKTIKKFSPKCALTVYHKELDIVYLPSLLLKAQPKYKLWFRCESEPVLYAAI